MSRKQKVFCVFLGLLFSQLSFVLHVSAQGVYGQTSTILKGEVKEIVSQKTEFLPGPDIEQTVQILRVEILEGEKKGEIVELQNDFVILEEGDKIFLNQITEKDGACFYTFKETNRVQGLIFFIGLFVIAYFLFTGKHGLRALLSLLGSFIIIIYFLLPPHLYIISSQKEEAEYHRKRGWEC